MSIKERFARFKKQEKELLHRTFDGTPSREHWQIVLAYLRKRYDGEEMYGDVLQMLMDLSDDEWEGLIKNLDVRGDGFLQDKKLEEMLLPYQSSSDIATAEWLSMLRDSPFLNTPVVPEAPADHNCLPPAAPVFDKDGYEIVE